MMFIFLFILSPIFFTNSWDQEYYPKMFISCAWQWWFIITKYFQTGLYILYYLIFWMNSTSLEKSRNSLSISYFLICLCFFFSASLVFFYLFFSRTNIIWGRKPTWNLSFPYISIYDYIYIYDYFIDSVCDVSTKK